MDCLKNGIQNGHSIIVRYLKGKRYPKIFESTISHYFSDKSITIQMNKESEELSFQIKINF